MEDIRSTLDLLNRIQQGEEDALLALHARYAGAVYSVAHRVLNDGMSAEEVTQDTFMRLWEKGHTYDPAKGDFLPWLLTIARRRALDVLRQRIRQQPAAVETFSIDEHPFLWEQIPEHDRDRDLRHTLQATLNELPEEQQQALALAYFYGMSHGDIAAYLNLPLGTIKTRLRLGMQKLRDIWHEGTSN